MTGKNPLSKLWAAGIGLVLWASTVPAAASDFQSNWQTCNDRIWIGPAYWANPMEDWQVADGRLECISNGGDRNVHLLTHQLTADNQPFEMSVRIGILEKGQNGSAGFRIGIHDDINDYRGNLLFGKGIDAGVNLEGKIWLGPKNGQFEYPSDHDLILTLKAEPAGQKTILTLTIIDAVTSQRIGQYSNAFPASELVGNIALVNNFAANMKNGSRFAFSDWSVSGPRMEAHPDRTFGPILWAMHTLSDSRSEDGHVMKMTAFLPPVGEQDNKTVTLEVQKDGQWKSLGAETMDPDARTATFRVPQWPADKEVPYRLTYTMKTKDGKATDFDWTGTVRKDPVDKPLILAPMTCQYHYAFPYTPLVDNLKTLNPDMLYFSGDQIYEVNGGYGIIRTPADRSILNYLRKFYLFGWAFGDLMRDRPTVCTPDDHDVFQGNLWGNGGNPVAMKDHNAGGYAQPPRMINTVHRTNTAHHPKFYDDTPIQQGISVWYGDMVYGRVSFAIVSDRMFKSGPRDTVTEWPGRPDIVEDEHYEVRKLDKPGLVLLGDRQEKFLADWVGDWRGADMKILLSQTVFAQLNTHSGREDAFVQCDLDAGGWPQTPRNHAIEIIRKGFALHVSGDQHLTTLSQYGVDAQRDSSWAFCNPAIAVGWQRWWRPDELFRPFENRPAHGLPNTGEYLDGFGNKVYVYAVGNPAGSSHPNRYQQADLRASGFGIVRMDKQDRTYTIESYRFGADCSKPTKDNQFPGFPHTIKQQENYGRPRTRYLNEVRYDKIPNPVVKVYNEKTDELIYALRLQKKSFTPWIFEDGTYTVKIGDPDKNDWNVTQGMKPHKKEHDHKFQ